MIDEPEKVPTEAVQVTSEKTTKTNSSTAIPYVNSNMPAVIAVMLTMGLLAFAGMLFFHEIPEKNVRLVDTLFGGLIVGCTTAWGHYFTTNQASDARAAVRVSKE